MGYVSLEVAAGFYKASLTGDPLFIINAIKKYRRMFPILRRDVSRTSEFCFLLEHIIKKNYNYEVAAKPLGAGGGGDILLVAPVCILETHLPEVFKHLKSIFNKNLYLDYASWLDGYEEEGVRVEQHLAEGIKSKFISEGTVSLRRWKGEPTSEAELSSLDELEKERKDIDLLIDIPENKIYIKGEKLTSKQLHSASATIEILKVLLENIGKSISNKKLPESSYSSDRNEMQSKIVTPLTKIIKQKTGKKLPLKVTGGLIDFYIKLDKSDLDIRILEKMF